MNTFKSITILFFLFALPLWGAQYQGEIRPVNPNLTTDSPSGTVQISTKGDKLIFDVKAKGLPPGMAHMQHIHGYESGLEASCPPEEADQNRDGVIDLIETRKFAGVTMIPLHDNPASMKIAAHTYPVANAKGAYSYNQTVSGEKLEKNFQASYDDARLALEDRVIFIHGIPENRELPESVESLEGVPAVKTVPIACAEIKSLN